MFRNYHHVGVVNKRVEEVGRLNQWQSTVTKWRDARIHADTCRQFQIHCTVVTTFSWQIEIDRKNIQRTSSEMFMTLI